MTNEVPTAQSAADGPVDSRPRLMTRMRLAPLAVLCAMTLALGVAGVFHDGVISSEQPAAAAAAQPGRLA